MFIILLLVTLFPFLHAETENTSAEEKYIDLLPEKEKKDFLENIAKKILEEIEVKTQSNNTSRDSEEVREKKLDEHSDVVTKLLKEETFYFRQRNEKNKEKSKENDKERDKEVTEKHLDVAIQDPAKDKDAEDKIDDNDNHSVDRSLNAIDLTLPAGNIDGKYRENNKTVNSVAKKLNNTNVKNNRNKTLNDGTKIKDSIVTKLKKKLMENKRSNKKLKNVAIKVIKRTITKNNTTQYQSESSTAPYLQINKIMNSNPGKHSSEINDYGSLDLNQDKPSFSIEVSIEDSDANNKTKNVNTSSTTETTATKAGELKQTIPVKIVYDEELNFIKSVDNINIINSMTSSLTTTSQAENLLTIPFKVFYNNEVEGNQPIIINDTSTEIKNVTKPSLKITPKVENLLTIPFKVFYNNEVKGNEAIIKNDTSTEFNKVTTESMVKENVDLSNKIEKKNSKLEDNLKLKNKSHENYTHWLIGSTTPKDEINIEVKDSDNDSSKKIIKTNMRAEETMMLSDNFEDATKGKSNSKPNQNFRRNTATSDERENNMSKVKNNGTNTRSVIIDKNKINATINNESHISFEEKLKSEIKDEIIGQFNNEFKKIHNETAKIKFIADALQENLSQHNKEHIHKALNLRRRVDTQNVEINSSATVLVDNKKEKVNNQEDLAIKKTCLLELKTDSPRITELKKDKTDTITEMFHNNRDEDIDENVQSIINDTNALRFNSEALQKILGLRRALEFFADPENINLRRSALENSTFDVSYSKLDIVNNAMILLDEDEQKYNRSNDTQSDKIYQTVLELEKKAKIKVDIMRELLGYLKENDPDKKDINIGETALDTVKAAIGIFEQIKKNNEKTVTVPVHIDVTSTEKKTQFKNQNVTNKLLERQGNKSVIEKAMTNEQLSSTDRTENLEKKLKLINNYNLTKLTKAASENVSSEITDIKFENNSVLITQKKTIEAGKVNQHFRRSNANQSLEALIEEVIDDDQLETTTNQGAGTVQSKPFLEQRYKKILDFIHDSKGEVATTKASVENHQNVEQKKGNNEIFVDNNNAGQSDDYRNHSTYEEATTNAALEINQNVEQKKGNHNIFNDDNNAGQSDDYRNHSTYEEATTNAALETNQNVEQNKCNHNILDDDNKAGQNEDYPQDSKDEAATTKAAVEINQNVDQNKGNHNIFNDDNNAGQSDDYRNHSTYEEATTNAALEINQNVEQNKCNHNILDDDNKAGQNEDYPQDSKDEAATTKAAVEIKQNIEQKKDYHKVFEFSDDNIEGQVATTVNQSLEREKMVEKILNFEKYDDTKIPLYTHSPITLPTIPLNTQGDVYKEEDRKNILDRFDKVKAYLEKQEATLNQSTNTSAITMIVNVGEEDQSTVPYNIEIPQYIRANEGLPKSKEFVNNNYTPDLNRWLSKNEQLGQLRDIFKSRRANDVDSLTTMESTKEINETTTEAGMLSSPKEENKVSDVENITVPLDISNKEIVVTTPQFVRNDLENVAAAIQDVMNITEREDIFKSNKKPDAVSLRVDDTSYDSSVATKFQSIETTVDPTETILKNSETKTDKPDEVTNGNLSTEESAQAKNITNNTEKLELDLKSGDQNTTETVNSKSNVTDDAVIIKKDNDFKEASETTIENPDLKIIETDKAITIKQENEMGEDESQNTKKENEAHTVVMKPEPELPSSDDIFTDKKELLRHEKEYDKTSTNFTKDESNPTTKELIQTKIEIPGIEPKQSNIVTTVKLDILTNDSEHNDKIKDKTLSAETIKTLENSKKNDNIKANSNFKENNYTNIEKSKRKENDVSASITMEHELDNRLKLKESDLSTLTTPQSEAGLITTKAEVSSTTSEVTTPSKTNSDNVPEVSITTNSKIISSKHKEAVEPNKKNVTKLGLREKKENFGALLKIIEKPNNLDKQIVSETNKRPPKPLYLSGNVYEVFEVPPGQTPFIEETHRTKKIGKPKDEIHKKDGDENVGNNIMRNQEVPHYAPVYNFAPEYAYYNPENRLGPNENVNENLVREGSFYGKDYHLREGEGKLNLSELANINKDQPYLAPVYNYAPENAYFDPGNRYGPNESNENDDDDENLERADSYERDLTLRNRDKNKNIFSDPLVSKLNLDYSKELYEKYMKERNLKPKTMKSNAKKHIDGITETSKIVRPDTQSKQNVFFEDTKTLFDKISRITELNKIQGKSKMNEMKASNLHQGNIKPKQGLIYDTVTLQDKILSLAKRIKTQYESKIHDLTPDQQAKNGFNQISVSDIRSIYKKIFTKYNLGKLWGRKELNNYLVLLASIMSKKGDMSVVKTSTDELKLMLSKSDEGRMISTFNKLPLKYETNEMKLEKVVDKNYEDNSGIDLHYKLKLPALLQINNEEAANSHFDIVLNPRRQINVFYWLDHVDELKKNHDFDDPKNKFNASTVELVKSLVDEADLIPVLQRMGALGKRHLSKRHNLNNLIEVIFEPDDSLAETFNTNEYNNDLLKSLFKDVNKINKLKYNLQVIEDNYVFHVNKKQKDMTPRDEYLEVMLDELKNMIERDDRALRNYNWLETAVNTQAAISKLLLLIDNKKSGYRVNPSDLELLKYTMFLHKSSKMNLNNDLLRSYLPRVHMKWRHYIKMKTVNVAREMTNDEGSEIELFNSFWLNLQRRLDDLHEALSLITQSSTYKNQNIYKDLKDLYLSEPKRKQLLEVLLHLTFSRLAGLIEDSALNGLEEDFEKYVHTHRKEIDRTQNEFVFLLKLLRELDLARS